MTMHKMNDIKCVLCDFHIWRIESVWKSYQLIDTDTSCLVAGGQWLFIWEFEIHLVI